MSPPDPIEERLGQALVRAGDLREADFARAQRIREQTGEPLATLLLKLGVASDRAVAETLAAILGLPLATPADFPDAPVLDATLSRQFLRDRKVLPCADGGELVSLAMADPQDHYTSDAIALACGKPVAPLVGVRSEIDAALERLYGDGKSAMGQIVDRMETAGQADEEDVEHLKDLASEAPIVRLVSLIIQRAVEARASDIHIEPFENRLKVRYRVDGLLRETEAPPPSATAAVISRVKLMARLNIAERRLPQDGRIRQHVHGKELDIRVSTVPTVHGESVVMRLLDSESIELDFAAQGFDTTVRERLLETLSLPHGMVLVTGPTGSGKTTTLYTALAVLNTAERKIITVEDPVEYQLEGVNQIQVKPQIGLTFANALRSIVRQDPDVIMVGEMRDLETARIAVQSALTGHLVLSTLHTNDAAGGVTRLLDMGVEDYLLTSTLNAIVAQRLVRTLCVECRIPYRALPEMVEQLRLRRFARDEHVSLHRPAGCPKCAGTGFRGRTAIVELLVMDDPLRRLILQRSPGTRAPARRHAAGYANHVRRRSGQGRCRCNHDRGGRARDPGVDLRVPAFFYKAATADGKVKEGEMDAPDQASVVARLQDAGYLPIRAEPARTARRPSIALSFSRLRRRGPAHRQVMAFTYALASLLRAGLPLDRSLRIMNDLADDDAGRELAARVETHVRGGASLSEALAAEPAGFSSLYLSMVRAGEAGGALEPALARLAEHLERAKGLRDSVASALIYPAILLVVAGVSVIVLLMFVIPQFSGLFEEMGQALPLPTRLVVGAGELLRNDWWVLVIGCLLLLGAFRRQLANPERRYRWDARLLRLPLLGDLLCKIEVARFSRTLGTMLNSGVPLLVALSISRETVGNRVLAQGLTLAADSLRTGRGLAEPLLQIPHFPRLALQLIQVGEESGQLEQMLTRVADLYDQEVKVTIQRLLALLEPLLIVGLGLIIAGIVMSILLAILGINQLAF